MYVVRMKALESLKSNSFGDYCHLIELGTFQGRRVKTD